MTAVTKSHCWERSYREGKNSCHFCKLHVISRGWAWHELHAVAALHCHFHIMSLVDVPGEGESRESNLEVTLVMTPPSPWPPLVTWAPFYSKVAGNKMSHWSVWWALWSLPWWTTQELLIHNTSVRKVEGGQANDSAIEHIYENHI